MNWEKIGSAAPLANIGKYQISISRFGNLAIQPRATFKYCDFQSFCISGNQFSKIPILNLRTILGKRKNLHKISLVTLGKWNFTPMENSAHTNWPLERPYYVYNAKTFCFFKPTSPYLTLHENWSNPIHVQYVIIALLLKEKNQNEL